MIRHANIAAVVVVVLHVAHLHRVVGNARASSVAAAHLCPSPPPPRRTSSSAPSGRHRSPWTRSGARSARTNCWSSMQLLLDATTPAFGDGASRGATGRGTCSWWPAMYCRSPPWPRQIVALTSSTARRRCYVARTKLPARYAAAVLVGVHHVAVVGALLVAMLAAGCTNGNSGNT